MPTMTIKDSLKGLMARLFQCEEAEIHDDTGPGDLVGWDSLGHVSLMSEIQTEFGVQSPWKTPLEVESLEDLVNILDRLINES